VKDFIDNNRSLPNEEDCIQVYKNEIHITTANTQIQQGHFVPFEDEDFKRIFDGLTKKLNIHKIKSINSLSLNINSHKGLTDSSVKYLRKILVRSSPCIKSLSLSLYGKQEVSKKGIEQMADLIADFKGLESLFIRFAKCTGISEENIKLMIKRIHQSQRYLKQLHVDLSEHVVSIDDVKRPKVLDPFDRWSHAIGCSMIETSSTNKIRSSEGLLQVNLAITNYFRALQSLTLDFSWCSYAITDRICQDLGEKIIERLGSLKRLALDFSGLTL